MFHCKKCQVTRQTQDHDGTYLVGREQEDIGARRVHLVTLTRMDGLLLHRLDLERLQFLIKHLTLEKTKQR
jgi:hypothetical protein